MGSGTVGKIDIRLGVTTAGLTKGVADGRKGLGALGPGLASATSQTLSLSVAAETVSKKFRGFYSTLAGAAALGGLTRLTVGAVKELDQLSLTAERAGLSAGSLQALQLAARTTGGDVDAFTGLVTGLNARLAQAVTSDDGVSLALQGIGLSARDLVQLKPDAQLARIGDALGSIEDPGRRAAAASRVFGEDATKLMRVLSLGTDGLARYRRDSEALNGSVTALDSAKVREANESFAMLGAAVDGVKTRLAVALAPTVAALSGSLAGLGTNGVSSVGAVGSASDLLGSSLGAAADSVEFLHLTFQALSAGATRALGVAVKAVGFLSKGVDALARGGGASSATRFLEAYADELDRVATDQTKKLNQAWLQKPPSNRIKGFYDEIAKSAETARQEMEKAAGAPNEMGKGLALGGIDQQIGELELKLKNDNATMGRSADFKELYDLKRHGATDEQLRGASDKSLDNSIKEDVMGSVRETLGKSVDPLTKIIGTVKKAEYLLSKGQLSQNDFDIAKLGARRDFLELQTAPESTGAKFAGAAELGSQEARSAMLQAVTGGGRNDVAQMALDVQKRALDYQIQMARSMDKIANSTPPQIPADKV